MSIKSAHADEKEIIIISPTKKKGRKSVYTKNGSIYARLCYSSGFDASLSLFHTSKEVYRIDMAVS